MTRDVQYRMAEFRASDDGAGLSGYASHFWSVDSYITTVQPGAFKRTVKQRGDRIPMLWQHDSDKPIGRPTSLKEDNIGLKFDAAITEATTYGRDAMALLRDGVPLGLSFGFENLKSRPATKDDPLNFDQIKAKPADVQVIEEVRLWEISLVTFPANEQATINDVRATAEADALASLIEHMRAGTLNDEHRALVAELVAAWQDRDPDPGPDAGTTPLADVQARRRTVELTLALAKSRGWIGASA
jgi:HK97 family phage prohead protease